MTKQKTLRFIIYGLVIVSIGYFGLAYRYYSRRAKATHDFNADFNAHALSLAPGEAAWPIYRKPFIDFRFAEHEDKSYEKLIFTQDGSRLVSRNDGDNWKAAVELLSKSEKLLDAFRAARKLSFLGLPLYADTSRYSDEDFRALFPSGNRTEAEYAQNESNQDGSVHPPVMGLLLPHCISFRSAARILVVDTRWAIEQNDIERVVQNVETIFGLGRQTGNELHLVGDLVSMGVQIIGYDLIEELLSEHLNRFSDDQLFRIQEAVSGVDTSELIDLDGEKFMTFDTIQRLFSDDGNGDGQITSNGYRQIQELGNLSFFNPGKQSEEPRGIANMWRAFSEPIAAFGYPSRKQIQTRYMALLTECELKLKQTHYADATFRPDYQKDVHSEPILKALLPEMNSFTSALFCWKGQQEATVTSIAIHRHKLQSGDFPQSLSELIGSYIEKLPIDQFDGQTLRYKRVDDGFILYSIGSDRVDDGGKRNDEIAFDSETETRPQPTSKFPMVGKQQGFDWVLWPRMGVN